MTASTNRNAARVPSKKTERSAWMLHKFFCRCASLFQWIARARAILLTRFKWIVVKLRDSSAKQPHPAAILLPFPILFLKRLGVALSLGPPGKKHRRPLSSDSIREHLRVNASPLDYIRGHVRCRQKEKSPWETKWRKTQYARVREKTKLWTGVEIEKGTEKTSPTLFVFPSEAGEEQGRRHVYIRRSGTVSP